MAGFVTKTGPTLDDLIGLAPSAGLVIEDQAVVDRTVTARTFADLVQVEAVQSLVKHHFSASEIDAIEKTMK